MAIGVVLGGALQLAWQIPSLRREGFVFHPSFDWSHPGLRKIITLMGPAILGNAAVQINVMVNTNFASRIPGNGPVSWLGYAFRFMQLPLGLFGVAIAAATLPSISRSAGEGNFEEFRRTLSKSLGMVFLLTVPSSVGLMVLGKSMIGAIYQGGKFHAFDTEQTALALSCYAIGLAGYAALKVLNPAFYALHDARTPMIISLISIARELRHREPRCFDDTGLGHAGLALTTSAVAIFGAVALFAILQNSHRRHLWPRAGRQHLENRRGVGGDGRRRLDVEPRNPALGRRRPVGPAGGSGASRSRLVWWSSIAPAGCCAYPNWTWPRDLWSARFWLVCSVFEP